jgi:CHAT domain-containing protein
LVHKLFRLSLLTLLSIAPLLVLFLPAVRGQVAARPSSPDAAQDAESLFKRAVEAAQQGRYRPSMLQLSAAVQLWHQAGQNERAIAAFSEVGDLFYGRAHWQGAIACYTQLLPYTSLPVKTRALTCISLAAVYACLRQFDLASSHYQNARAIAKKINDRLLESQALSGLANVAFEKNQLREASELLNQALVLQQHEKHERAQAETLRLIGQIQERQGRALEARGTYEQALALYHNAGDSQEGQAQLLSLLSNLALAAGQKQEASERATLAVSLVARLYTGDARWRAHLALARAERALGQLEAARKSYLRACFMIEGQLLSLTADALRIAFMEDRQAAFCECVTLLINLGRPDEAFHIAERARARGTLNLLGAGAQDERKEITPEQINSLHAADQEVKDLRSRLQSPSLNAAEQQPAQAQLQAAEQRRDELWLAMQMARRSRFVNPVELKQIQTSLVGSNATLIEFMLGEDQSYAWLVSATEMRCVTLPARCVIEHKVTEFLAATTEKPNSLYLERELTQHKKLAAEVFEMLMGPFRSQLQTCRRLFVAPDGVLYYLPFSALAADGHYLVESSEIAYIPSASAFGLLMEPRTELVADEQMDLLAIGNPVFDPQPAASRKPPRATNKTVPPVGPVAGISLPRLPNTGEEVRAISELFPAARRTLYLDQRATEDAFKRETLRRYRRIHIATHSIIDERYPSRSGMVLTSDKSGQEDGLLTVDEVAMLDLRCRLVVLSACQTGRGRLAAGEGMVGLARAFLYAGAQSVAVTLWNVSDISTANFMRGFYTWQAAGASPLAALRQAKLEMLKRNDVTRHPYYWAPFVLVGNPN